MVENSNALIEQNDISKNIECNLALGGSNSHHSVLLENTITESPGVGLHLVHSGRLKVIRNDISRNEDGVVLTGSQGAL